MTQPSQIIADRYRLRLSAAWEKWFDNDVHEIVPAGLFRLPLTADRLSAQRPIEIWPGFMLPDTLPLVSNGYGDWLCVRIEADDTLGELLHWYHGGGDWIPLGPSIAEALLHDVVDQFRPVSKHALRAAEESLAPHHRADALELFREPKLRKWFIDQLAGQAEKSPTDPLKTTSIKTAPIATHLEQLTDLLQAGQHTEALQLLYEQRWTADAVACDLIEAGLQLPLMQSSNRALAAAMDSNWSRDFIRWMFDVERSKHELRSERGSAVLSEGGFSEGGRTLPAQDWTTAERLAGEVLSRRQNLAWPFHIYGWARQRSGDISSAVDTYFAGRLASAYADQAVRLRTHFADARYGKFSVAQLSELAGHMNPVQSSDKYLQVIFAANEATLVSAVSDFWSRQGMEHFAAADFSKAYDDFYRAGWDMGMNRLTDYATVLSMLVRSAEQSGCSARAAVAQTHLDCLAEKGSGLFSRKET